MTATTTTVAVHDTTSSSCGWGDHCNHCKHSSKHNSNHLSVNQWIRSAIRDSQQRTSPIGFLFWNFRHRLVRYYWYIYVYIYIYICIVTLSALFQIAPAKPFSWQALRAQPFAKSSNWARGAQGQWIFLSRDCVPWPSLGPVWPMPRGTMWYCTHWGHFREVLA